MEGKRAHQSRNAVHIPKLPDIFYKPDGSNDNRAVFVVPRRVYYDNRLENGKPRNAVIILAEVHDDAVKTIRACELNGHIAQSFTIVKENATWVRTHYPKFTHLVLVIECMGLPQDSIFNGSLARLIYKLENESNYSRVESEQPLFLGDVALTQSPAKGNGSIVLCVALYHHPDRLDEWLRYHKHLGVEGIYVQADTSFSENATHIYPYLNDNRNFYFSQLIKYQACVYRHIGVFEYGLFLDYDDFFNPIIPNQKNIHYYFSKFFSNNVGSVCMQWRQMECRPIEKQIKDIPHGNLTSILSGYSSKWRTEKKCAHRLNAAVSVEVHNVQKRLPGYRRSYHDGKSAYVAHNRHDAELCAS